MARRRQQAPVPLNQQPRTRTVMAQLGAALVALPPDGRPILPAAPAPPPRALPPPTVSSFIPSVSIGSPLHDHHHNNQAEYEEYTFRGSTRFITREDWNSPEYQAGLRAEESAIRERERRERLRRRREGGRRRGARRAAWRRAGGEERLR
ncbi:hypothetical protein EG329_008124 [Mollisiaceae sp. DMI_Dod_QoI]|nr:hypothetical protein EG329_008124 [Helotiales sp. DMI_Dod_QoI]